MERLKYTKKNSTLIIKKAVDILKNGGILVFPTETCYGMGADATNQKAIDKLYQYKTRREGKPLSIAVSDIKMASKYVEINEVAENIYKNYLPGPITVVSKGLKKVARGVESEYGTLGIRIPNYELVLEIIRIFGKPITATSANVSYMTKPYSIEALLKDTPAKSQELIDLIIDAGELPHHEVSTVADTTMNNLNIMRPGQINLSKQLLGQKATLSARTNDAEQTINFGGMNMLKYIDEPLDKPLVFFLIGELGAGKTQFSKGLANELNIKEIVKSPTFTILNEYEYKLGQKNGKFIHVDTWRIDNPKDLETIGLDEYLHPNNVIAIEWADKFSDDLKNKIKKAGGKIINVVFKYIEENERSIETYE
jgi:tRNA threonylcarbamoyl adenosine modification protein (Sua5/YciO/YrdC/YwlC family)/tRNA threonylcarbamoyl adenosine modification protein YjeE